jgi:hypothetical protein
MIAFSGEKFPDEYVNPFPEPERMSDVPLHHTPDFTGRLHALIAEECNCKEEGCVMNDIQGMLDELASASRRSAIEECVAAIPDCMKPHNKTCCELWGGCDCVSCGCGLENKKLREARSLLEGI